MKKARFVSKAATRKNGIDNTAQVKILADRLSNIGKRYERMASMYSSQYRERDLFPASFCSQHKTCEQTLQLISKICPEFLYITQKSPILSLSMLPSNVEKLAQNMLHFTNILSACSKKIIQLQIDGKVLTTYSKMFIPTNDRDDEKIRTLFNPVSKMTEAKAWNLSMAAELYDTEPASEFLNCGEDPNEVNEWGETALHHASSWSTNPGMVDLLVSAGANINAKTNDNGSPLLYAVKSNPSLYFLSALIKNGADVNAQNDFGITPLMVAAAGRLETEATEMLLTAGADPNAVDFLGRTALMFAVTNPNPEVTHALLKAGADAKAQRKDGKTASKIDNDWNLDPKIKALLGTAERKAA